MNTAYIIHKDNMSQDNSFPRSALGAIAQSAPRKAVVKFLTSSCVKLSEYTSEFCMNIFLSISRYTRNMAVVMQ